LLYHDIAPAEHERFASQLRSVAQRWRFVSPDQFTDMVLGRSPVVGRNVMLTFDDGFVTDRTIAEHILAPLGIRALFFVVPDFVDCVDSDEALRFVAARIRPGSDAVSLPGHLENMTWSDLSALLDCGHTIGAHTRSHARLSDLGSTERLDDEIVGGANLLERRLGVSIDHFAFPFGNLASFSPAALRIARDRFQLIFSGLRGDNANPPPAVGLRREAVPPGAAPALVGSLLEGSADFLYRRQRRQLGAWDSAATRPQAQPRLDTEVEPRC